MQTLISRCLLAALLTAATSLSAQEVATAGSPSQSRQVILIIGDGMDEQQITIARNYLVGATGELTLDRLPNRANAQILTTEDNTSGRPVYVADSANTASAMATGVVTSRGRIATTAGTDQDIETIAEMASAAGLRTGLVTTASITDATAAAFVAHIGLRLCENPDVMEEVVISKVHLGDCIVDMKASGGKGSVSEQLAESDLHVVLGGGSKHFTPLTEGGTQSVLELAQAQGFNVVETPAQLQAAAVDQRLLGVFAPSTLPVRLRGEDGREAEKPKRSLLNYLHRYLGSVTLPAPMVCEPNPQYTDIPSLKQMTDKALAQLSHNNDKGFFLMVESASIDKQSHERKPCGSIGELAQLNEALDSALTFAKTHPNTLIMVTADHAQAAQLIPYVSLFAAYPIPVYSPGLLARIITPEGSHMAVNYATSTFFMEEHTGASVPLLSNSEGQDLIPPYVRQPQIFEITRDYLGL